MALGKYCKVAGAIHTIIGEHCKVGGAIRQITVNAAKVGGNIKEIPVAEKTIFVCEPFDDRLHAIDDTPAIVAGWPKYGADGLGETITDPLDVACDSDGNSYWVCTNGVYKVDLEGNILWRFDGHTSTIKSICVDSDGNVYTGDYGGVVKKLNSSGVEQWSKTLGAGYAVYALCVDHSAGIVYAGTGFAYDAVYRLFVSNGNFVKIYTAAYDVSSIAIDEGLPSLYVGEGNGHLLKISTAGYVYWDLDKDGDIYAVRVGHDGFGYYANGSGRAMGKFTLSNGGDAWKVQPSGTAHATGIAPDQHGNAYGSYRIPSSASLENVVRKRNSSGVEQWTWQPYTAVQWCGIAVTPGIKAAGF